MLEKAVGISVGTTTCPAGMTPEHAIWPHIYDEHQGKRQHVRLEMVGSSHLQRHEERNKFTSTTMI